MSINELKNINSDIKNGNKFVPAFFRKLIVAARQFDAVPPDKTSVFSLSEQVAQLV